MAHGLPQLPGWAEQWSGLEASCAGVKQPPPPTVPRLGQNVLPPPHWKPPIWHTPSVQRPPPPNMPGQTVPHAPQFCGSCFRSTQAAFAPHAVRPGRQAHLLVRHAWAAPHVVPHMPQLSGSSTVSVQTLLLPPPTGHMVLPAAQLHMPAVQTSPCSHALLQLPQWAGSVETLVHVWLPPPPHMMSPDGQLHTPETQVSPVGHWCCGPQPPQ